MKTYIVGTDRKENLIDITKYVHDYISEKNCINGILVAYVPHTTAALVINENADPNVIHDILYKFDEFVSWHDNSYRHMEGNSAAHIKAIMCGNQKMINVVDGKPVLGTWESLFFAEFDGPRRRTVHVSFIDGK